MVELTYRMPLAPASRKIGSSSPETLPPPEALSPWTWTHHRCTWVFRLADMSALPVLHDLLLTELLILRRELPLFVGRPP